MDKDNEGNKTIKLCIYFHTSGAGAELEPKIAFKSGWVSMPTNHKHGIRASEVSPVYFGPSQATLQEAIKTCLIANRIKFVELGKEREYRKFQELKKKEEFYDKEMKL